MSAQFVNWLYGVKKRHIWTAQKMTIHFASQIKVKLVGLERAGSADWIEWYVYDVCILICIRAVETVPCMKRPVSFKVQLNLAHLQPTSCTDIFRPISKTLLNGHSIFLFNVLRRKTQTRTIWYATQISAHWSLTLFPTGTPRKSCGSGTLQHCRLNKHTCWVEHRSGPFSLPGLGGSPEVSMADTTVRWHWGDREGEGGKERGWERKQSIERKGERESDILKGRRLLFWPGGKLGLAVWQE